MFIEWFEKNYFLYACACLCGLGILIKVINNLVYWRLVKASENMSTSKNKLVKEMKTKFESFYKLKIGVNNVDIFVDKYVYRKRSCGLLLSTWDNLGGLMFMLCLITGLVSSVFGLIIKCGIPELLSTIFASVASASILLVVDNLCNIKAKKYLIKINITDYLENYLKARLEQEALHPEEYEAIRLGAAAKEEDQVDPKVLKKEAKEKERQRKEEEHYAKIQQKQQEKEERQRQKEEKKQAALNLREEQRLKVEEEKRLKVERKEKQKQQLEAERLAKRQKVNEERLAAERLRSEDEQKLALKRQESERRLGEEMRRHEQLNQEQEYRMGQNQKAKNAKNDKAKERHDRLKEEIMATREQRNRELAQGKDPFETYMNQTATPAPSAKSKNVGQPVNDFNSEYEMRVKAAQKEELRRKQAMQAKKAETVAQPASASTKESVVTAKQPAPKKQVSVKGKSPYEDKVIDDILKEFLA